MLTQPSAPAKHAPSHAISDSGGDRTPCINAYAISETPGVRELGFVREGVGGGRKGKSNGM